MKKIRKNNKGFTLVELIIVIAIIAILTAVAAPQYIKYVDKGRLSKDMNEAASLQTVVEAHLVDVNSNDITDDDITAGSVEFTSSGVAVDVTTGGDDAEDGLTAAITDNFGALNGITVTNKGDYSDKHEVYTIAIAGGKLDVAATKWDEAGSGT